MSEQYVVDSSGDRWFLPPRYDGEIATREVDAGQRISAGTAWLQSAKPSTGAVPDPTAWVWQASQAKGSDRLVLLAIASVTSPHTARAFISQPRLADMTGLSESTIRRSLRALERAGELVTELALGPSEMGSDARWRPINSYRLTYLGSGDGHCT